MSVIKKIQIGDTDYDIGVKAENIEGQIDLSDYTLKSETGNLEELETEDKTNLVNAINEVANSSGGRSSTIYEITLTTALDNMKKNLNNDDKLLLAGIINDAYSKGYTSFALLVKGISTSNRPLNYIMNYPLSTINTSLQTKPSNITLLYALPTQYYTYPDDEKKVQFAFGGLLIGGLTWNGNECTIDFVQFNGALLNIPKESNVLTKNNTSSYTPSAQYHPATKKYVDDSITSAITTTLGGEF